MKIKILTLVSIFLLFPIYNSYSLEIDSKKSKEFIVEAEKSIENSKYHDAINILKNISLEDPFYSKSNFLLLKSHIKLSENYFLENTDRAKNLEQVKLNLDKASFFFKNTSKDEEKLDLYLELLNAGYGGYYYSIALEKIENENYKEGITNLNNAIKYNSKDSFFYDDLSFCFAKLNKYEEAIKLAKKGLKINPKKYNSHYSLAIIYSMMNNKDNTIYELKESIRLADFVDVKNKAKQDKNFNNIKKLKEFIKLVK